VLDALLAEARLRWALDPADGVQVATAERLVASPIEPSRPLLIVPLTVLLGRGAGATGPTGSDGARATHPPTPPVPLPGRAGPGGDDPLTLLRRLYPAEHPVGRFRVANGTTVGELTPDDLAGPLYLAPIAPELAASSPWSMPWISDRLRRPDGCPWDREQTHESLRKHLLEEAYEVYDALGRGASPELADELGDLLLQVVLHAQLAAEAGIFDLVDIQAALATKIVRRHPHVFGDAQARTTADVTRQWETIKATERADAARTDAARGDQTVATEPSPASDPIAAGADGDVPVAPRSALEGISRSMPALAASQEMQERAAALGYDWPTIEGIVAKVHEELAELLAAETPPDRTEEIGDLLMVLVNLARRHGVEAEAALRSANDKFRRRFGSVERAAAARGVALRELDFAQLDELWDAAKDEERASQAATGQAAVEPAAIKEPPR
jgi:NTP pyrophosphatase (non-canonical NTP hydrolase)